MPYDIKGWCPSYSTIEVVKAPLNDQYLNLQPLQKTRLSPQASQFQGEWSGSRTWPSVTAQLLPTLAIQTTNLSARTETEAECRKVNLWRTKVH